MVGTLALRTDRYLPGGDTQGQISKVTAGNYLGQNYGKVTRITEWRLN